MALSCFGVRGCASGSPFAAAVSALSSFTVGKAIEGRLEIFDIVFHLTTIGTAKADNPSQLTAINKRDVAEDRRFGRERYHARLAVFETVIDPNQRRIAIELNRHLEGLGVTFVVPA